MSRMLTSVSIHRVAKLTMITGSPAKSLQASFLKLSNTQWTEDERCGLISSTPRESHPLTSDAACLKDALCRQVPQCGEGGDWEGGRDRR